MPARLFAVGDVHGCREELVRLLDALPLEEADCLVFLGDYVDRGPDSAGVVATLLELAAHRSRTIFLRGNHEDMLLDYLRPDGVYGDAFVLNGGHATAASYGVAGVITPDVLASAIPPAHRTFFARTALLHTSPGVVCVHAGIRPGVPLEEQMPEDLLWIREEFLRSPHGLDATVVFGHTPQRDVLDLPGKLGIDTGCVYGGMLTAVELPARVVYQIRRGHHRVERHPLPPA
jgi:serine/threonine protein phosphatase 1